MSFIKKHQLVIFFVAWFLLNLFQSANTELFDDEAYYWMYSKFPDWGYFDHPPMIAILIRTGYSIFHNELGVRLFIITMSTLTLAIIYSLLPKKNDGLFYAIVSSFAVLQIGGIIAAPDIPLAFFTALFFWAYNRFIRKTSLKHTLLLGLVMALMLYSKYHGILILAFSFLSNPKLALKYQTYIAALTCVLLFLPHLYWQYTHGFPSVRYHLVERNASEYHLSYSGDYILGQILIAGPLTGWLLLWAAFRYKPRDLFEKALKFSMVGCYFFFLVSTLKGRVEANWTTPVFLPLIILSFLYLQDNLKLQRLLKRSVPITLLLVLAIRIYMLLDISPIAFLAKDEVHKNKSWAESISRKSKGRPVVFIDSYQKASKYWFYSGIPGFSLNTILYRRNNFNFWAIEDSLYDKPVAVSSLYFYSYFKDTLVTPLGITSFATVDSFFSFSKVRISGVQKLTSIHGNISKCTLNIVTDQNTIKAFQREKLQSKFIELSVTTKDSILGRFSTNIRLSMIKATEITVVTDFKINLPKGEYEAKFALPTALSIDPSVNSHNITLIVQ